MKRILTLTILVFSLLNLCASYTGAQPRSRIGGQAPKAEKAAAIKLSDISAPVPTNNTQIVGIADTTIRNINFDGTSTNFHTPKYQGMIVNFDGFVVGPANKLYGLSSDTQANNYGSHLFIIGPDVGPQPYETLQWGMALNIYDATTNTNARWYCHGEGDLAYEKGGSLYATCKDGGVWKLVTIDRNSALVNIIGPMPGGSGSSAFSALAFNSVGELYALDTFNRKLWKVDKTNPSNNPQLISLTPKAGQQLPSPSNQGGMGFSDGGGGLYAFFGGKLVTINTLNGTVTTVTGNNAGYVSGLIAYGGGVVQYQ